jgi:hypothetical protein
MSRHLELYHYTSSAGFEGIVKSQTLWCSHFSEMLDTDEIKLMRQLLPPSIAPLMDAIVAKENRHIRRLWDKAGRGEKTARDLVNSLYGVTFDGQAAYTAFDAYLFSFSTHADDSVFDRQHGIRSQWDQYAGLDGYCFVFDIREMACALAREGAARYWAWLVLKPVRYADRPVEEVFPELVHGLADTLRADGEIRRGQPSISKGTTPFGKGPVPPIGPLAEDQEPGGASGATARRRLELNGDTAPSGDCHHRRPSDLVLASLNGWEKAYGKVFDHSASRLGFGFDLHCRRQHLDGVKLRSLILHSDRDVLQMTPTDF